jgi:hypothetical protein
MRPRPHLISDAGRRSNYPARFGTVATGEGHTAARLQRDRAPETLSLSNTSGVYPIRVGQPRSGGPNLDRIGEPRRSAAEDVERGPE